MKRTLIVLFLFVSVFSATVDAQRPKRAGTHSTAVASDCPPNINGIRDCPDQGCGKTGQYDPNLNKRKNIRSDTQRAALRSIGWIKNLADPTGFTRQSTSRAELIRLGEGQKITVTAYALVARKGGAESCNCGLTAPKDTDNHIVLVDPATTGPTLAANEDDSVTAEFTPRVRLDHPNFTREKLEPLIAAHGYLGVRVTGLLMFDSEHFLGRHLKRHNNWEIHPVLKLEYCPEGQTCTVNSNANWKDLESQ